jgi:minor extracellular serine protease Vpr
VDLKAVGVRFLAEDVCGEAGGCLEFAISTHGRRPHPAYPGGFEVDVDINADGLPDFAIYNEEVNSGSPSATGQTFAWVQNLVTGTRTVFFYADADLNSGNMILTAAMSQLGVAAGTTLNFSVLAYDNYFSFLVSDELTGMRFTPGAARFNAVGDQFGEVPARTGGRIGVTRTDVPAASTTEKGVLLMHRRNVRNESDVLMAN